VDVPTHAYNTPKYALSLTHTHTHLHTHTPQTQAHKGCLFALVRVVCTAGWESRFSKVASVQLDLTQKRVLLIRVSAFSYSGPESKFSPEGFVGFQCE